MASLTQASNNNNILSALSNWNKQENSFGQIFSQEALKDREFLKMKLREYNRIWYQFKGTAGTTDEKAMLTMLRFQRRKLERGLHRGLLRRLIFRGVYTIRAKRQAAREAKREATQSSLPLNTTYLERRLPAKEPQQQQTNRPTERRTHRHQNRPMIKRSNKNRKGHRIH